MENAAIAGANTPKMPPLRDMSSIAAFCRFIGSKRCQAILMPLNWTFRYSGHRYIGPPTVYKSEVRGSVPRVKNPCEQGLPRCTYVLQAEQRLPHATEEKAKRSFPMERGPTATHHRVRNPQCTQWFRAEEFPLLCPTSKVMPRFSLGDVG